MGGPKSGTLTIQYFQWKMFLPKGHVLPLKRPRGSAGLKFFLGQLEILDTWWWIPVSSWEWWWITYLLMEEIRRENHLGCIKPPIYYDKLPINWSRISSINSIWCFQTLLSFNVLDNIVGYEWTLIFFCEMVALRHETILDLFKMFCSRSTTKVNRC